MRDAFRQAGARVELIWAPKEHARGGRLTCPRPEVVAAFEGSRRRPVLLIGTHMDVVGQGDEGEWIAIPSAALSPVKS